MLNVQLLKLIVMYLSLSTRQAIQFKSSAKKYQQVCTELGGVSSWKVLLLAANYIATQWQRGGVILVKGEVKCTS